MASLGDRLAPRETISVVHCPWPAWTWDQTKSQWLQRAKIGEYDTSWLPEIMETSPMDIIIHADRIELRVTGYGQILDSMDRLDFIGTPGAWNASVIVAAAISRGWDAVELYGPPEMRRDIAFKLARMATPVIVHDSPLSPVDLEKALAPRPHGGRRRPIMLSPREWKYIQATTPPSNKIGPHQTTDEFLATLAGGDLPQEQRYTPADDE